MMTCAWCPVGASCLGPRRPDLGLCDHAASNDPVLIRRVVDRHRFGPDLPRLRSQASRFPEPSEATPASSAALWAQLALRDRFALHRAVARCPSRVRDPSCGCCGRGCARLGRSIDYQEDCIPCVTPDVLARLRGLPAPAGDRPISSGLP